MNRVLIEKKAEKGLRKLPREVKETVYSLLNKIASASFPSGSRKIVGTDNLWRIRIGDYRILYEVDETSEIIRIERIGHRKDVYR
ncbi:MAG: type II toxin-antitoxin system RelE family toxin [Leptospirillum sp.]